MSPTLSGAGVILVDSRFRPIALDCGAKAILADFEEHGSGSLPPEILNLLNARSPSELDSANLHVNAGDRQYSCRAFTLKPQTPGDLQPMVALYLKRELSVVDAVYQISADYRLTDREQEALIGVTMGLTSKEVALRMKISPNTVKAFLRLIMIKMGVTTRVGIVGKLLDQNNRQPAAARAGSEENRS